jgi:hypothetical protein
MLSCCEDAGQPEANGLRSSDFVLHTSIAQN